MASGIMRVSTPMITAEGRTCISSVRNSYFSTRLGVTSPKLAPLMLTAEECQVLEGWARRINDSYRCVQEGVTSGICTAAAPGRGALEV
jgi:cob(I)alamin adenosyltransferase